MYPHIAGNTLDVILIPQFRLVLMAMARRQKKCVNGEWPWEDIKHADDKPKELWMRPGRKGWKVMLIWH